MFGLFASQEKKMRGHAANWLELSDKVYNYRRDVLPPALLGELQAHTANVRVVLKEKNNAAKLKLAIEALEEVLRRGGGKIYPKSSLIENVEFFLVAAIVILGIRTYFVQPFKIPTNSMWPSYFGMTPEVFTKAADEPTPIAQLARLAAFGARSRRLDAPVDGEVSFAVGNDDGRGYVHYQIVPGRSWLVLPTKLREYSIYVNDRPVTVRVPLDFDFDWAIREAYFPQSKTLKDGIYERLQSGQSEVRQVSENGTKRQLRFIRTGKRVQRGERILSFDILTGDQLFVDRFSYHFFQPPIGSGFVFRTGNIPQLQEDTGDQYYIKRLVGAPGDQIEIVGGQSSADSAKGTATVAGGILMRNGAPITGADAFRKNNEKVGLYSGYQAMGLLAPGEKVVVPPHSFLALGDNSGNSKDGRYWGFVPSKDVVGRPLWIYYPFTKRWGPAR